MQLTRTIIITPYEGPPPPPGYAKLVGHIAWGSVPAFFTTITLDGNQAVADLFGNFELTVPIGSYTLKTSNILYDPYQASLWLTEDIYEITIQLTLKTSVKILSALTGTIAIAFYMRKR